MAAEVLRAYMQGVSPARIMRIFDLTAPQFACIIEDQLAGKA